MEIAFAILLGFSVVIGWPIAGWLLAGVYAPRKPLPACPRCEYDVNGMHPDTRCPECGLTHEQALRCLPARAQPYRSWWFIVPTVIVVLLAFFSTIAVAAADALICLLPLSYVAYVVTIWNMATRLAREDRGTLAACWICALVITAYVVLAYLLTSVKQGHQLSIGNLITPAIIGAIAVIPLGGIPLLLAAVLIHRRWRAETDRAIGAARESTPSSMAD